MRIAIIAAFVLSPMFAAGALLSMQAAWGLLSTDYLSVREVCRRWGEQPLDIAVFRSSGEDTSTRAAMACALLRNQDDYIGLHQLEIRPLFGNHTGYYITEGVPTYLIEVGETQAQDSWQIVFLLDSERTVSKVVVHKNCCRAAATGTPEYR